MYFFFFQINYFKTMKTHKPREQKYKRKKHRASHDVFKHFIGVLWRVRN